MRTARYIASVLLVGWAGVLGWNSGCGGNSGDMNADAGGDGTTGGGSGGGSSGGIVLGDAHANGVPATTSKDGNVSTTFCAGKGTTTLSGKVFDPAGKNPVYNVAVFSPYTTPGPMPAGLTCNCSELYTGGFVGQYALTDATGSFKLTATPSSRTGGSIPLVLQIGKWRTQTQVQVNCGQDNVIPDGNLRLPSRSTTTTSAASDPASAVTGDIPSLAISTGGADTLECLLTRIGVSENEYTPGASTTKKIHIFQGSPVTSPTMVGAPLSYASLWDKTADLSAYDAVLLSCEGAPTTMPNSQALFDYATTGGRVFASHYHYQWFLGSPWPGNMGTWYTTHANQLTNPTLGTIPSTLPNGVPFPAGQAMKTWLSTVGSLDPQGKLSIVQARHNVDIAPGNVGIPWMYFDPANSTFPAGVTFDPVGPTSTLYFSYDTMGAQGEGSCGRVVYSDLHIGGNSGDYGEAPNSSSPPGGHTDVPTGCNASINLSDQEKALEFMLFDLTSCLAPPGSDAGVMIPTAQ